MREQTQPAFRTLLHGPRKTGAWRGGRTNAVELTEACATGLRLCCSLSWLLDFADRFQGLCSSFGTGCPEQALVPPFVEGPRHLFVILPPTAPLRYSLTLIQDIRDYILVRHRLHVWRWNCSNPSHFRISVTFEYHH